MKPLLAVAMLVATFVVVAASNMTVRADPFDVDRAIWTRACDTYASRARLLPADDEAHFPALLAEACPDALAALEAGNDEQRDAAARFLSRLTELRDTIAEMNMDRAFGSDPDPRATPSIEAGRMTRLSPVSPVGEYLIAREIGVQSALAAWRETGAPSLAAR